MPFKQPIMSIENGVNPEILDKDGLTPEQREYADGKLTEPKFQVEIVEEVDRRDCEVEVAQLESLFEDFESKYSLYDLSSITELTRAEAEVHPLRKPAQLALNPIYDLVRNLESETNINKQRHDMLKNRYLRLSKAVGSVTKDNKVRH